jgi:hypothetical protein
VRLDHITPKQFDVCVSSNKKTATAENLYELQNHLSHTQFGAASNDDTPAESLDDHRALEPPDPIPNSVVKRCIADGSVGFPHVRVGHRQAPIPKPPIRKLVGGFTISTGMKF